MEKIPRFDFYGRSHHLDYIYEMNEDGNISDCDCG
jgi:hypothetical protein